MADLVAVKNNVRKMLASEFGTVSENDNGNFFITNESSVTFVSIDDWEHNNENVGVVEVFSIVVSGLKEINKDLAVELCTELSRRFGTWFFVKRDDGLYNLIFKIDLIAATLDSAELINAVLMVAIVSNAEDDGLVRKYGGEVFISE
jgi:hypothetical protein